MKHSLRYIYSQVYGVLLLSFAFYWGENFTVFVRYKGDDFIVSVAFAVLLTYLLLTLLQFTVEKLNILLVVLLPVFVAVLTIPIGMAILLVSGMDGTPAQLSLLYSTIHGILTVLSVLTFWKPAKLRHSKEV